MKISLQFGRPAWILSMLTMTIWLVCTTTPMAVAQDKEAGKKQEQVGKKSKSKKKDRVKNKKVKKGGKDGTSYSGNDKPKSISAGTEGTRFRGKNRPKKITVGSEGTRSSGNDRPKSIGSGNQGTRFSGKDRPKSISSGTQGTRFSGKDRPKTVNSGNDGTRFSGKGRAKTISPGTNGTNYRGNSRPKTIESGSEGTKYSGGTKAGISTNEGRRTIYGVRGYNNKGKGQKMPDVGPSPGTQFKGNNRRKFTGPADGESFAGHLKSSKRISGTPGTRHRGNLKGGPKVIRDYGGDYRGNLKGGPKVIKDYGGDYSGNLRITRKAKKTDGTEYAGTVSPGIANGGRRMTIYGERGYNNKGGKVKIKDIGPSPGTTFRGHLRKSKKITNWDGADFAGNLKIKSKEGKARDFKKLSKDQQYAGHMKVKSKGAKERDFKKQSKEEQLFAGNIKIKRNKNQDLHPSSEYRGGKIKNSLAQKERVRKRKLWWSKTKKNDDQPKHLKEKRKKPKYDPKEGDIWND